MKVFKYLLVLFFLCSLTSQENVAGEIKKKFFSKIKTLLKKRGSFDYNNDILNPKNILSKKLIIDRVKLNTAKINEIGKRYNLESKAIDQIRAAFFQSQPNIFKDFEFSLNSGNLNQIVNNATFTEYIGCCFRQDHMINYIILRLSVFAEIYGKTYKRWYSVSIPGRDYTVPMFDYKPRPLNDTEKLKANNLIRAYSAEIFNLMIEDVEKETTIIPQNLVVQSVFTTGQIFNNESYYVQAEITDYGDVEISVAGTNKTHVIFKKECKSLTATSILDITEKCKFNLPCDERKSEYLIADENGKSSCSKLKELKKEKKNIKMEIYTDGSFAIKSAGGILFYAKPNIKGKGPFSVGVTRNFELQIIDSQKVVVWKSNPVFLHDVEKKKIKNIINRRWKDILKTLKKNNK